MAKIIYKEELRNIHSITQSGDFLCLSNSSESTRVDVKKHLKSIAGRVLITVRGNPIITYSISIKINPILRSRIKNVESADEIELNWNNPNMLEYSFTIKGEQTWNSESVFGLIPIHSFEIDDDGGATNGLDLIFIASKLS